MTDVQRWKDYASERIVTRNGDTHAAWRDVLGATALISRLYPPHRASQSFDAALAGFGLAQVKGRG
jgi:hypothetical protein